MRKVEQCYTKLGKNTYRYQDIEILDFTADIVVDDDGLVVVYPNLFTSVVSVE
ncbi:MAG: putative glycolipid-binding domain-containing protein [Patescibacteria group bacterium]